jgi:DNA-binding CsgD family transcriptional regulator
MRRSTAGALAVVEAAYRVEATDSDWLTGIANACIPQLDRGFGLCAFEYQHIAGDQPRILQASMVNMPEALAEIYPRVYANMDSRVRALPFAHGPCTTASQMLGLRDDFKNNELMQRFAQKFGIYDSLWITAAEPSGWGCGLHAGRARIGPPPRAAIERWSRLGAHLAAAARLRRRWKENVAAAAGAPDAEAVFSGEGRVLHAEGPAAAPEALKQLRSAVLAVEGIRARQSTDDDVARLQGWKALVAGRWSLIDSFEENGRRYIVAHENEPRPPGLDALTKRERQIIGYAALGHDNKVIAYDMGIAHSTVRVLVARAASKLGVRSRDDVITAYRSLCRRHPPAASLGPIDEAQAPSSRSGAESRPQRSP